MADILAPLQRLLSEADSLANAGDLAAARDRCQEASSRILQLSQLCHDRPQLRAEADTLFSRLKATVDRLKKLEKSSKAKSKAAAQRDFEDAGLQDDNPYSESNLKAQMYRDQQRLEQMNFRETEMNKLAQDMIDLEEIFRKVNELVAEQGEQINLIEDQVGAVEVHVEQGAAQLEDAVVNKRASRKKKIIIICAVVAAVLVLALVLYLVLSKVL